jgi:hypothetical protein
MNTTNIVRATFWSIMILAAISLASLALSVILNIEALIYAGEGLGFVAVLVYLTARRPETDERGPTRGGEHRLAA